MAFTLPLPGVLAEIAELAGESAAMAVARARGGTRAYIPSVDGLKDGHWLPQAVGMEAARRIAERIGGGEVDIPLGPYAGNRAAVRQAIRDGVQAGHSEAAIARLAGVADRTVRRHKNGHTGGGDGLHGDQNTLF